MKHSVFVLIIFLCISQIKVSAQWEKYIIDSTLSTPEVVAIGDLNGDTKPDVVVNDLSKDKIFWYENNHPHPSWIKHTLDSNLDGAYVTEIGDLDGDGDLDVVASGYLANVVVWYENNNPVWTRHTIAENLTVSGTVCIADIDGDDTLDVVSAGYRQGGDLVWYENNHPIWTKHTIRSNYPTEWSCIGDINGDGAIDIVVNRWYEGEIKWFRNENAGLSWTEIIIDKSIAHASQVYIKDIDGDNDMDIAAVGEGDDLVVWYENNHPDWLKHIIDQNLDGAWGVAVVEIDGDENQDVAAVSRDADIVVWYNNNHPEWEKYIIDTDLDGADLLLSADIDNDNALDLVVPGMFAGNLVWYKNPYTTVAQSQSLDVTLPYLFSNEDTLVIKSQLINPENHSVNIHAYLLDETLNYQDSLEMYDDGLHGDEEALDNIYSSEKYLMEVKENFYWVMVRTIDLDSNFTTYLFYPHKFTNIGPIKVNSIEHTSRDNQEYFKLVIQNDGNVTSAKNLAININTSDDRIRGEVFPTGKISNLAAGVKDTIEVPQYFYYVDGYNRDSIDINPIQFDFTVAADNVVYWRGSFTFPPTDSSAVKVENTEINIIPQKYALEQNYPNPFNPSTTIKYQIPGLTSDFNLSYVELKVYDILGSEVATLVNQKQKPGFYEVEFDGGELTSGIYFYRIQTGEFIDTKKMLIIK